MGLFQRLHVDLEKVVKRTPSLECKQREQNVRCLYTEMMKEKCLDGKFEMFFPPFKKGIVLLLEAYFIKINHFQESTLRFKGVIFFLLKNYFFSLKINACVFVGAELFHMKRRSMVCTYMLQNHQVVQQKRSFALKQIPNGFSPFGLIS